MFFTASVANGGYTDCMNNEPGLTDYAGLVSRCASAAGCPTWQCEGKDAPIDTTTAAAATCTTGVQGVACSGATACLILDENNQGQTCATDIATKAACADALGIWCGATAADPTAAAADPTTAAAD